MIFIDYWNSWFLSIDLSNLKNFKSQSWIILDCKMRPLTDEETEKLFAKLAKYVS